MTKYVALFRGVNVGGHRKLVMAELRDALRALGYTEVATYLQSGNAVFASPSQDPAAIAHEIEAALARDLGVEATVLVRTGQELADVIAANPFPGAADPARLHVAFLSAPPHAERLSALDPGPFLPDEFRLGDRALYLWLPNGLGRSKLVNELSERRLGVRTTIRSWNTVVKLLALATT